MPKAIAKIPQVEPIVIGCFTLTETGVATKGRPTFDEYQGVLDFATRAHKASAWWVADLTAYADTRTDWREHLEAAMEATGYAEKTVRNIKYVGENVAPSRRRGDVDFSLHSEVANLSPKEQSHWLDVAATEGWSVRELRVNIRASKRTKIIQGQAKLEGQYRVIYADPPWNYRDSGPTRDGSLGKAERHYHGMTIDQICELPVEAHSLPNAVLFMWVTAPMLLESPGPREVIAAWGFKPKGGFVWDKVLGMPGAYNHVTHEHLIVATRGFGVPDRPTPQPKSVFTERRGEEHSGKPASVRTMIERLYDGPYLELFGREPVEGWTVFGNDARLWAGEREAVQA